MAITRILIISLIVFSFSLNAQKLKRSKYINKTEIASLWLAPTYILEDEQYGLNWKLSYQLESFLAVAVQGDYFATNANIHSFGELRAEAGFYTFLLPSRKFTPYLYIGVSRGRWWSKYSFDPELRAQYGGNFVTLETIDTDNFHDDQSGSFGLGFSYEIGKPRVYVEYKYLPDIYSNYLSFGMQYRFYKGKKLKVRRGRINK